MTSLKTIYDGIKKAGGIRERERKESEKRLGKPLLFVPDLENKNHGMGYFKITPTQIAAYRKWSNGYEIYPTAFYEKDLILKLVELFAKKD